MTEAAGELIVFEDFERRLESVRARIASACARAGRATSEITLIAVTKGHPFEAMKIALAAGLSELGENRVQEGLAKLEELDDLEEVADQDDLGLPPSTAHVHLIGRLQNNKVNKAVGRFSSIAAVDRLELLERIQRRAAQLEIVQPVWIQVNISGEVQKAGCDPARCAELWDRALEGPATAPLGLMGMGRLGAGETELGESFGQLRRLAESLRDRDGAAARLSMGMSDDFEVAILEGSTHVRLGTALFGPRQGSH